MSEPLAARIRPEKLADFVGQAHLVGPGKPLRIAIEQKHLFSFILWGPPGVGKTTLERLCARSLEAELYELSAVSAGKDDIKKILQPRAASVFDSGAPRPKILFLDEIHRFNKSQQDFLLPYVESGALTLVGATTENPSFEVIAPLLSRCRVFVLNELSERDMEKIIKRTGLKLDKTARDWLVRMANGDARQAISVLDNASSLYGSTLLTTGGSAPLITGKKIDVEALKNTVQNKFLRFDKKGEEHYNTISAFIKSMRASQPDAALYYLSRMIDASEDPKFIARRMVVFASEDIGMAQPTALVVANEVFRAVETIGLPEAGINLAHGVVYLAEAPKDRSAYDAYGAATEDVKKHGNLPIPKEVRNAPTKLMKELGYHKGYDLPAGQAGMYTDKSYLPAKLAGKRYYIKKNKKKQGKCLFSYFYPNNKGLLRVLFFPHGLYIVGKLHWSIISYPHSPCI